MSATGAPSRSIITLIGKTVLMESNFAVSVIFKPLTGSGQEFLAGQKQENGT
jgi:hypothetical protein